MSVEAVHRHFIERFINNYGAPIAGDQEALYGEYERALTGTEESLLKAAADLVIDQNEYRSWPTVGSCKKAIETVAARRDLDRRYRDLKADEPLRTPSKESKERVSAMMQECVAKLKVSGPPPPKEVRMDASRPAWEARFGKPQTAFVPTMEAQADE